MLKNNIRIEYVTVADIDEFASHNIAKAIAGEFIPITRQRALAMSKNPNADSDDVALLLAYSGEKIVGYFGIMTVMIKYDQKLYPAQWFTTWMVSSDFVGKGVGSMLMQAALDLNKDYFIVGSKLARRVCDKFGFIRLPEYEYTIIDFRLAYRYNPITLFFRILRKMLATLNIKISLASLIRIAGDLLQKLFGRFIKVMLYAVFLPWIKGGVPQFRIKYVNQVKNNLTENQTGNTTNQLHRNEKVVNWMLSYPWVLKPGQSISEHLNFNFSDARPEFDMFAIELYAEKYLGYIVYQFSVIDKRRVLKVLDVSFQSERDHKLVLSATLEVAKTKSADQIELDSQYVVDNSSSMFWKFLLTKKQRICQIHPISEDSLLSKAWPTLKLNYVDGDTPFS